MSFRKRYQLSDEEVNTHGFWVRTEGLRLDAFSKNAPLFYDHRTWELPVGHVENIAVENGKLFGDVVIEGADQREKEYIRKIENGDLKGVSLGLDPISWNEAPEAIKMGQTRPTLWESEPFELSLTPLPSSRAALALRNGASIINLSASDATTATVIPTLKPIENMKAIALKLGLNEGATEQDILNAISAVQLSANSAAAMRSHLVYLAKNKLNEEQQNLFGKLIEKDFDSAVAYLNQVQPKADEDAEGQGGAVKLHKDTKVTDLVKRGKVVAGANANADDAKNCYDYLSKHNVTELARIRAEEPERYAELTREYAAGKRYKA